MKTLNDYMAMSYRMEIIEDKEGGAFKKRRDQIKIDKCLFKV